MYLVAQLDLANPVFHYGPADPEYHADQLNPEDLAHLVAQLDQEDLECHYNLVLPVSLVVKLDPEDLVDPEELEDRLKPADPGSHYGPVDPEHLAVQWGPGTFLALISTW